MAKTCWCRTCKTKFTIENGIGLERSDLKDIMNLQAFKRNCPECKQETLFNLPVMYQDMDGPNGIFVWLEEPLEVAQGLADHFHQMGMRGGIHRLVNDPYEFAEKLTIFQREYDDRAVEIVKFMMMMRIHKEQPNFRPYAAYFDDGDNGDRIVFVGLDGDETSVPFIQSMYEYVLDEYAERWHKQYQDNAMVIDTEWAINFMENNLT